MSYQVLLASVSAWVYVSVGWGASAVALVGYAILLIVRGKRLTRVVPPEERRWS